MEKRCKINESILLYESEKGKDKNVKPKKNYLDLIPQKNPIYDWKTNDEGIVDILIENKGVYHWLAQKLLKKPRISRITLEKFGSFIWLKIDGQKSIYEISTLVSEEFGKDAEPLIERLVTYFRILKNNHFIKFQ